MVKKIYVIPLIETIKINSLYFLLFWIGISTIISNPAHAIQLEKEKLKNVFAKMHVADSPLFSEKEKTFVLAAEKYINSGAKKKTKAIYRVDRDGKYYLVFAQFFELDKNGKEIFWPGGHCLVKLNDKAEVLDFFLANSSPARSIRTTYAFIHREE